MSETEHAATPPLQSTTETAAQPPAPEAVAETHPPVAHEAPEVKSEPPAPPKDEKKSLPGWPRTRYHPVFGAHEFPDPFAAAEMGQDDEKGDWRFKSAAAADMARTDTEAGLAVAHNMRTKLAEIDEHKLKVARNSASAQEALDKGYPEPL